MIKQDLGIGCPRKENAASTESAQGQSFPPGYPFPTIHASDERTLLRGESQKVQRDSTGENV